MKQPMPIRTYGFNIPCRRFLIRANVTRDRRLPVVDEYVLRVLKLCEEVPVRRLASFFGLSSAETEIVMADLAGADLVVIDGDAVRLHPSTRDYFQSSDDGTPRVIDVDSWVVRLWFDLVSRNMVSPDRVRSARHLIDIRPNNLARELPSTYAQKTFEDNFPEYLRKIRRIANPDKFALYSVSEAIPERFGSLVFRMEEDLVFDPDPLLRPNLAAIEAQDVPRFRPLVTAMLDAYRGLTRIDSSAAAISEFAGLAGETTVTDSYAGQAHFDLSRWWALNDERNGTSREGLVGASYLRKNIDTLTRLIDHLPKASGSVSASSDLELVWYRPGGSGWGCSPDIQDAILAIKLALRRRHGKVKVRTKLICPAVSRRDHPERFRNVFDEGWIAPAGFLSPALEIVHIPGVAVLQQVAVAVSPITEIPVGIASTSAEPLSRTEQKVRQVRARFEEMWRTAPKDEEGEVVPPDSQELDD